MTSRPAHLVTSIGLSSLALCVLLMAWVLVLSGCEGREQHPSLDLDQVASPQQLEEIYQRKSIDPGYSVAFDLRISPLEDARQYQPLIDYLKQKTGHKFRLRFQTSSKQLEQAYVDGKVDFAIIGAGSYLALRKRAGILPLVRGLNSDGEPGYRSYLVARIDSPLQGIRSLVGRRLALGDKNSTQGALIPRILLAQEGLSLDDLAEYFYTGSHRECAEAVLDGSADACGLQDILARQLIEAGELRPLAISEVFPSSGIFVSPRVPESVRSAVRDALLKFDPLGMSDKLYHWDRTEMAGGFTAASPADYKVLDRWQRRFSDKEHKYDVFDRLYQHFREQAKEEEDPA